MNALVRESGRLRCRRAGDGCYRLQSCDIDLLTVYRAVSVKFFNVENQKGFNRLILNVSPKMMFLQCETYLVMCLP